MTHCPQCNAENIEGVDRCAECGQPMGDLALRTPANRIEQSLVTDRIAALQPRKPIVVAHDMTVGDVLSFMLEKKIGCVFVTKDDKVVGVFTERDVFCRLDTDASQFKEKPISEFMTPEPKSITADAKVAFAVRMMDEGRYRHILVVDKDNNPQGVTSVRDILSYLAERMT